MADAEPEPAAVGPTESPARTGRWLVRGGMVVAVMGWLWPIGAGGQIPVGGDATQFSMGLMAFLRESLRVGRWPLWNDLWGFGFPALAESQMGVYYPPHGLYALLSTETAYAASLAAHFAWGALGAAWLARRLGVSERGAALSGFAWATSGFFLIHLPHQWSYTVGSWMPWSWGLAWGTLRASDRPIRPALGLAAVLAVQMLPGHFQLAFITQVGVLGLALASWGRWRGIVGVLGALAGATALAAAQLVPTMSLARLAATKWGFEYLSGFAASPVHLVGHVAPGLFHRSPLWRPIAWDLFHAAPEEYLGYVGLVPLFLAARGVLGGWRDRSEVRALTLVGVLTLLLSLGPYVPGFRGLIALPGFSFFRAPARWSLATSLALAVLAGFGFDAVARSGWRRRSVVAFVLAALLAVAGVIGGFELALRATRLEDQAIYRALLATLPWAGDRREASFEVLQAQAHRPQADLRVQAAQARLDGRAFPPGGLALARERGRIYAVELGGSAVLLTIFGTLGIALARRPRSLAAALIAFTVGDMVWYGRARPFDLGPARSLVEQSPVLARAAAGPRGSRTLDPGQNLFLVAGAESATAYRTLTLPTPADWLAAARGLDGADSKVPAALRALGIDVRVLDPFEAREAPSAWDAGGWGRPGVVIRDPTLAGWLYGADFARINRVADFRWVEAAAPATRAWRVGGVSTILQPKGPPLTNFRDAVPLESRFARPGRVEVDLNLDPPGASPSGPSRVVVTQTFDPGWSATWMGPAGVPVPAEMTNTPEGWQAVAVPTLAPGRWTLVLEYQGWMARLGLAISVVAWSAWVGLIIRDRRRWARSAKDGS